MRRFARSGTICIIYKKKTPEKHPKSNTPPRVFFTFLNCKNNTKSRKASHMQTFYAFLFNIKNISPGASI